MQTSGNSRFLILGAVALLLVAAHTAPLYFLWSHKIVSAGAVAALLGVLAVVHLMRARR